MPPRFESELDRVTLMNLTLYTFEQDPTDGFKKLNFLLMNPPFPTETFGNLLLMYCKFGYNDRAADVLAEHSDYTYRFINEEEFDYLDAIIFKYASVEETFKKF